MMGGIHSLSNTDKAIATSPHHSFTTKGQLELKNLVLEARVKHLWTSNYDLSGMLEMHLPETEIFHAWGDISLRGRSALPDLIAAAKGSHLLVVRPTAPMIYNLTPNIEELTTIAASIGAVVKPVSKLEDKQGAWAELYAVN